MNKYILNIILALVVIGCSTVPPMETKDFKGITSIQKGDIAKLKWDFSNAYYVEIDGYPNKFQATDSLLVTPEESTVYKFSAIQDKDTINKTWRVIVMIPEEEKKLENFKFNTSYTESEYFKGVMDNAKIIAPNRLKITNVGYGKNYLNFSALIMDEFGNYIPGMTGDNKLSWKITQKCESTSSEIKLDDYEEFLDNEKSIHNYLLIDKSAAAEYLQAVEESVRDYVKIFEKNDRISISSFDQNLDKLIENSSKKELENLPLNLKKTNGLNATYKNAFKIISDFKSEDNRKSIVLINFSSNNAATIYNISDVIEEAKAYNIPVYMISIGDAIDSFSAKYLAYGSGGAYYDLPTSEIYKLKDILSEIYFSNKAHYKFKIPIQSLSDCNFDATNIVAEFNNKEITDQIYIVKKPEWLGSKSQSIALFDYKSEKLESEFDELILSLARVLNDNPGFSLELIGHSSIEGSEDTSQEISFKRAKNVSSKFQKLGVDPSQLKVRAEGSSMPIYFLPNSAWQQHYNRRVEVRWLIPEMLPYEIIAQEFWTEEEAIDNANEWRKRGYQSYYERFLVENMPKYKVKLWGYRSIDAAKEDISQISSKYEVNARIE